MGDEKTEIVITLKELYWSDIAFCGISLFWTIVFIFILPISIFLIAPSVILAAGIAIIYLNKFKAVREYRLSSWSKSLKYWPWYFVSAILWFSISITWSNSLIFSFNLIILCLMTGIILVYLGVADFIISIRIKKRKSTLS